MKKLLALVLALVMTLGLATVSSSAAYSDEADVSLNEAVDVMSAVGVFQGADGKFSPKANLNREQAAKLIAYLDLGESAAEALPAVKVFSDVPATSWSAKYIAYCADAGYIAGDGTGKFNPAGELTGYAFGKMILCVLGYDADIEGFTGNAWSINVAKLMESNDIADGIDGAASATLTREQAAQYCLNALKATTVKYDTKGTSIEINGAKIATGASKAEDVTGKGNQKFVAISGEAYANDNTEYTVELGEKLYGGDLKLSTVANGDDFGRNAKAWTYKNGEDIATHAESADLTFVADETYDDTFGTNNDSRVANAAKIIAQINDQLNYTKASSKLAFTGSTYNEDGTLKTVPTTVEMYTNGVQKTLFEGLQIGDVVELYLNDSDNKKVDEIVVIRYSIAKITKVDTTLTKAQKDDGATCKITVDGVGTFTDDKIEGFNAAAFVKDAYIMYIAKGGELIATEIPATVEGKVDATKGGKVQIGGTYYEKVVTVSNGDKGTFYLGKANQIIATDTTAAKSTDYAYIYNWTYDSKANSDGVKVPTITLYYVTVDGVKASAVAKTETTGTGTVSYYIDNGTTGQGMILGTLKGTKWTPDTSNISRVVAFSLNSDGKFVQKTPKDSIVTAPGTATVKKTAPVVDNSKVATNETGFVFVYTSGDDVKVKTATGYKNVDVSSATMTSVYNSDNEALYTFIAANNSYKTDTKLAVVLDKTPSVTTDDGDTFNTYAVAVDGAETKLTFKNATLTNPYAGMVFAYTMDGSNAKVDTSEDDGATDYRFSSGYAIENFVKTKGEGYFGTKNSSNSIVDDYLSTAEAKVYTITIEFKNEAAKDAYVSNHVTASVESVTVSEGASFDVNDPIYYTIKSASDKTAGEVYVVEYVY